MWVRAAALDFEHQGVVTLAVTRGIVDTGMPEELREGWEADFPDRQRFIDCHRTGRLAAPDAVARSLVPVIRAASAAWSRRCTDLRHEDDDDLLAACAAVLSPSAEPATTEATDVDETIEGAPEDPVADEVIESAEPAPAPSEPWTVSEAVAASEDPVRATSPTLADLSGVSPVEEEADTVAATASVEEEAPLVLGSGPDDETDEVSTDFDEAPDEEGPHSADAGAEHAEPSLDETPAVPETDPSDPEPEADPASSAPDELHRPIAIPTGVDPSGPAHEPAPSPPTGNIEGVLLSSGVRVKAHKAIPHRVLTSGPFEDGDDRIDSVAGRPKAGGGCMPPDQVPAAVLTEEA